MLPDILGFSFEGTYEYQNNGQIWKIMVKFELTVKIEITVKIELTGKFELMVKFENNGCKNILLYLHFVLVLRTNF